MNTAYDDVFRTLLNERSKLIIPLLNEIFGEDYTGEEEIIFSPNELFIRQQDSKEEKRITDSSFKVISKYGIKKYLLECQSNPDSSMLIRIYEYAFQSALLERIFTGDTLKVTIPHCAILFLRSTETTPDKMMIEIETPKGSVSFDVEVIKVQSYSLEELFEKRLLFLLPYYIFKHEKWFKEYNEDEEKLYDLQAECHKITVQLDDMIGTKEIDYYTKKVITEMSKKVVEKIAHKYENVVKGVHAVMGGEVLDFEAKKIHDAGKAEGRLEGQRMGRLEGQREGRLEGKLESARALLDILDDQTIANKLDLPIDIIKSLKKEMNL